MTDKDVMQDHVKSQIKCSHCDFESNLQIGIRTHMGHKHKDLENIEIVREPETANKSFELSVIVKDCSKLNSKLRRTLDSAKGKM